MLSLTSLQLRFLTVFSVLISVFPLTCLNPRNHQLQQKNDLLLLSTFYYPESLQFLSIFLTQLKVNDQSHKLLYLMQLKLICPSSVLLISTVKTAAAKSLQSCPTLCDPIDGSPPGSPVPGILQARTPEWVAISFSNA